MAVHSTVPDQGTPSFLYVLAPNKAEVQVLSIQKAAQGQNLSPLDINGPAKAGGITISTSSHRDNMPIPLTLSTTGAKNLQGMTTFSA